MFLSKLTCIQVVCKAITDKIAQREHNFVYMTVFMVTMQTFTFVYTPFPAQVNSKMNF